jgi:hypothetical protein
MKLLPLLLLWLAACLALPAQAATYPLTSDITGVVVDAEQRPIAGAVVVIRHLDTGRVVVKTTNSPSLPIKGSSPSCQGHWSWASVCGATPSWARTPGSPLPSCAPGSGARTPGTPCLSLHPSPQPPTWRSPDEPAPVCPRPLTRSAAGPR